MVVCGHYGGTLGKLELVASNDTPFGTPRLLLLGCTRRKRSVVSPVPALEMYDGPTFRLVRRFLNEYPDHAPDIYVLSAKYGLIAASTLVVTYDKRLSTDHVADLRLSATEGLRQVLTARSYLDVLLCMGRTYLGVFSWDDQPVYGNSAIVANTSGSLGMQLVQLRRWLCGEPTKAQMGVATGTGRVTERARLRGVDLNMSAEDVLQKGRDELQRCMGGDSKHHSWYVRIDDNLVSPKWLVSRLTGLPVGSFHSIEARRVLQQLGVEVFCE